MSKKKVKKTYKTQGDYPSPTIADSPKPALDNNVGPKKQLRDGMLFATWIIAASSIAATLISLIYYQKQVDEMKKATKMEWRPYLNISYFNLKAEFQPIINILDSAGLSLVTSIPVDYLDLASNTSPGFVIAYRLKFANNGKIPLRIIRRASILMDSNTWIEKYKKSEEELVRDGINSSNNSIEPIDVIVNNDTAFYSDENRPIVYRKTLQEFKQRINSDSSYTLYLATYCEYEDFLKNKYNVLLMEHYIYNISISKNILKCILVQRGIEKYRWDIGL